MESRNQEREMGRGETAEERPEGGQWELREVPSGDMSGFEMSAGNDLCSSKPKGRGYSLYFLY